jgi:hypothetical protein
MKIILVTKKGKICYCLFIIYQFNLGSFADWPERSATVTAKVLGFVNFFRVSDI